MTDIGRLRNYNELPALTDEQIEDAEFYCKDLAWSEVVRVFYLRKDEDSATYQYVGERIKKSGSQIHRWLSSPTKMTLKALGLIAEALDADVRILVQRRRLPSTTANEIHPLELAHREIVITWAAQTVFIEAGNINRVVFDR